jgi:hypothetical protein
MAKEGNAEILQFMSEHDTLKRKPVDRPTVSHDVLKSFRYLDGADGSVAALGKFVPNEQQPPMRSYAPDAVSCLSCSYLRRRRRDGRAAARLNGVGDSAIAGDDVSVAGDAEEARAESGSAASASGGKQRVGRNERGGDDRRRRGREAVGACEASASASLSIIVVAPPLRQD